MMMDFISMLSMAQKIFGNAGLLGSVKSVVTHSKQKNDISIS